jgi:peptide/nickel transport system ATP-binding protein
MGAARDRPLLTIGGEPPDPRRHPPGCAFGPRCPHRVAECENDLPPMRPTDLDPHRETACLRVGGLDATDAIADVIDVDWTRATTRPDEPPALQLIAVHKSFPVKVGQTRRDLLALRGVDLKVARGESVALVGESGCGKSTLLRVAAGLVTADDGVVQLGDGARPQMVFQDAGASLTPWLTVGQLVGERLREEGLSRKARSERVRHALQIVGLPEEVAQAKAAQLSGGQRQRVGMARAIVVPPQLLLCDEPTSALDVSLAATVLNLLGRLRREFDMAMLFVTHDLAAARVVADRIAVMYLGAIVEEGLAEAIARDPIHPYTRTLLGAVPAAGRRRLVEVRGEPASPLDPPPGCAFHPRCAHGEPRCSAERPLLLPSTAHDHRHACVVQRGVPVAVPVPTPSKG